MLHRVRIALESYSNRARIAIVIGPLRVSEQTDAGVMQRVADERAAAHVVQLVVDAQAANAADDASQPAALASRLTAELSDEPSSAVVGVTADIQVASQRQPPQRTLR